MRRLLPPSLLMALACAGGPTPETDAPSVGVAPAEAAAPPKPITAWSTAARPSFPLVVGDRWTWQITRSVGAGLRLLFIPTEPAQSNVDSNWELTIDGIAEAGRYRATWSRTTPGGLPARTDLVLWQQDGALWMQGPSGPTPALEMTVPPEPVATEKVPCVAHFLEGLPGICSPAPGGPLRVPPGPVQGVVSSEDDGGRTLAQVLVGIGTAGMIIPGNKSETVYADLTSWTPKAPVPPSDRVERWRAAPEAGKLDAVLGGPPLDREEAAAIVALTSPADLETLTPKVMAKLSPADRVAMVRVALGVEDDGRLALLAHLAPALGGPPTPERADSVARSLPEEDQAAARGLMSGEWAILGEVLRADEDEQLPTLERALQARTPAPGEAEAITRAFSEPAPALGLLLEHVAPNQRLALVTQVSATCHFDEERLALLDGHDAVLAAESGNLAGIGALLDTYTFDEGTRSIIDRVIRAAPANRRPPLIRLGVQKMDFDEGRLGLLDAWPAEVRAMSKGDRSACRAAFVFEQDEARKRLGG